MLFDDNNFVVLDTMNQEQARAFILFLKSERRRHQKDIYDIDDKIELVEKKFKLWEQI